MEHISFLLQLDTADSRKNRILDYSQQNCPVSLVKREGLPEKYTQAKRERF